MEPWGRWDTSLPTASGKWIPQFASFLGPAFASLPNLSLPHPTNSFCSSDPLHPNGVRERLCGAEFKSRLGSACSLCWLWMPVRNSFEHPDNPGRSLEDFSSHQFHSITQGPLVLKKLLLSKGFLHQTGLNPLG